MILKRMTATFGCLDHQTLELSDGLNILTLPNEAGKSTWAAFLRVMLYGLNTRERDRKGYLADKSRYAPWSGKPMEGELICVWQGREMRVRRFSGSGVPMGGCEITYTDSGENVPGLGPENIGDVLIGVSRDVFARSAFLSQNSGGITQTPELEKRLLALVSSGEEGVSASQTKKRLSDWQRRREFRSRGEIPALKELRTDLERKLVEINGQTALILSAQTEIDRLEEARAQLQHQIALHEARSADEQARAYQQAKEELDAANAKLGELLEAETDSELPDAQALDRAGEQLAELRVLDAGLDRAERETAEAKQALQTAQALTAGTGLSEDAAEARAAAQTAVQELSAQEQRHIQKKRTMTAALAAAVLAALAAVICLIVRFVPGAVAAAVVLLIAAALAVTAKNAAAETQKKQSEILGAFHAQDAAEITAKTEQHCVRLTQLEQAKLALQHAQENQRMLHEDYDRALTEVAELVQSFEPQAQDIESMSQAIAQARRHGDVLAVAKARAEHALTLFNAIAAHGEGACASDLEAPVVALDTAVSGEAEAGRRIERLNAQKAEAIGRRGALGDADSVTQQLMETKAQLRRQQADYDALTIAMEAMDQADAEMRSRFSPELNRRAGEYFNRLTEGRYQAVRLNRELEAGVEEENAIITRDVVSLSQGTADQLWLSVRLAICDLALPTQEPCPLVLDEALSSFDDCRAAIALNLLQQIGEQRQILLFTCHGREQRILSGK